MKNAKKVENGNTIKVHYTGTFDSGDVFDSSEGKEPLQFTVGSHQVIPGFDNGVLGMKEGEEKTIKIQAKEAYGERNEKFIQHLPKDKVNVGFEVKPGHVLMFKGPNGEKIPSIVKEVGNDKITIDLNHPLAGKNLNFKVKVVAIA